MSQKKIFEQMHPHHEKSDLPIRMQAHNNCNFQFDQRLMEHEIQTDIHHEHPLSSRYIFPKKILLYSDNSHFEETEQSNENWYFVSDLEVNEKPQKPDFL